MQGWHAHRLLANGIYGDHILKDKDSIPLSSRDKNLKGFGVLKRKKASSPEGAFNVSRTKVNMSQEDSMVIDVGEPADWVKINVRQTKDCFEIYALVPGLLREEPHTSGSAVGVENPDDTLIGLLEECLEVMLTHLSVLMGTTLLCWMMVLHYFNVSYGLITCGSIFLLQVVHVAFFYGMTNM